MFFMLERKKRMVNFVSFVFHNSGLVSVPKPTRYHRRTVIVVLGTYPIGGRV